ncbi:MAG: hypothetical protein AAGU15_10715 [Anaerolineaceae bacterium]
MKEVVIFTEGVGELIFIREMLILLIDNNDLSLECMDLRGEKFCHVPYKLLNPTAKTHFYVINVGCDERVLSVIKERGPGLLRSGKEIIGIRDMFSEQYKKCSNKIDPTIIKQFCDSSDAVIQQLEGNDKVHLFFAIMELEAWFLSFFMVFERLNSILTVDYIKKKLNYDLINNDPEITYFHPSVQFSQILELAKIKYGKHEGDYHKFIKQFTSADVKDFIDKGFCDNLQKLLMEFYRLHAES